MYKEVDTDTEIELENGEKAHPLITLADEFGGRAQLVVDDHCLVLYLERKAKGCYEKTAWWFKEIISAMVMVKNHEKITKALSA